MTEVATLAPGLDPDRAVDLVWLLNSPAVHQQLVRRSGWSNDDYADWLGGALVRELLGPQATQPAPVVDP